MKEINCNIIRDLLPLYEDDAVSGDTAELVREHLKDCPACREELRRMRAPDSMPLDSDPEMLKRFATRIQKVRRKRTLKILCAAALVILAILCLWYTRPQTFSDLAGDGTATYLSAYYSDLRGGRTDTGLPRPNILTWKLQEPPVDSEAAQRILAVLSSGRYRASLRNLLPWSDSGEQNIDGTVQISLALTGQDPFLLLLTSSDTVTILGKTYSANESLYDALSILIQEYGVLGDITQIG